MHHFAAVADHDEVDDQDGGEDAGDDVSPEDEFDGVQAQQGHGQAY